jgi:ribosomal protein S18 acetylase RimI-like enzyme
VLECVGRGISAERLTTSTIKEVEVDYRISKDIAGVDWDEAALLLESVDLGARDPLTLMAAFKRSRPVFVYDGNQLVGIGRSVTDELYYATIFDVGVKKEYQGQGIGRIIMESLMEDCKGFWFVHLTSTPGNEPFYKKFSFRLQKTAMTVMNLPDYPEEEAVKLVE